MTTVNQVENQMEDIVLTKSNIIRYKQWRISHHSLERYIQRVGGDLGNMVMDLEESWLPMSNGKHIDNAMRRFFKNVEGQKGYCITNGKVFFLIKPGDNLHHVVTCITNK